MPATNKDTKAKRRLDLGSLAAKNDEGSKHRKVVENPYLKASKKSASSVENPYLKVSKKSSTSSYVENPYAKFSASAAAPSSSPRSTEDHVDGNSAAMAVVPTTITPEAGIEKFFRTSERRKEGDAKPRAARGLVTPREAEGRIRESREEEEFANSEEEDPEGLHYHSSSGATVNNDDARGYEPGHIHSTLGYHHRGDLTLDRGMLKAYRFVRDRFLVPRDIESDPKFGPHSGSCFEERVVRAYALGRLEPKKDWRGGGGRRRRQGGGGRSLLVCSHCGEEGHTRDDCPELLRT